MLRGDLDSASEAWKIVENYSYQYTYDQLLQNISKSYPMKFRSIVKKYERISGRQLSPLKQKCLNKYPEIVTENVQLLKNAIELWYAAKETSHSVQPIIFHYSYHCFNSFFLYSLFRWNPPRSNRHGLWAKLDDDLTQVKIIIQRDGVFLRLLDVFTLFGVPLLFSKYIPKNDSGEIDFIINENVIQNENNEVSLDDLLYTDYREVNKKFNLLDEERISQSFFANAPIHINRVLSAYIFIFLASSIARYRPALWQSILAADNELRRDFMKKFNEANMNYLIGAIGVPYGFIGTIQGIFRIVSQGHFRLKDWNRLSIVANE